MKKFLIVFFGLSVIGITFFRPLVFKRNLEIRSNIQIDSVYYYHGFPISSIVRDIPRNKETKEYELTIEPVKFGIWIGSIESDIDRIDLKTYKLPEGWKRDEYGWINFYDASKPNKLEFKIKAKDYIKISIGRGPYEGAFRVRINNIEKYIDAYSENNFVDWVSVNIANNISISPESRKVILKLESADNLNLSDFEYEILDNNKILIKNLKVDYKKIILNSLLVVLYSLFLSIILSFSNSLFLKYFSIIFTVLLIYFLSYFPGLFSTDSIDQVTQAIGLYGFHNWHTPFHTLTIKIVLILFHHVGFYVLIQIVFASILFAWILKRLNLRKLELYLIFAFAFPITGLMLNVVWKDIPFSLSVLWLSFLLYFAYQDKNYLKNNLNLFAFIVSLSFVMLFRYNGIPLVVLILIFMFFAFREHFKRVTLIFLSLIVVYLSSEILFYKVLKVQRTPVKYQKDLLILGEYVVSNFQFDKSDRKVIEEIKSFDDIRKSFYCYSVVPLMWGQGNFNYEKFSEHRRKLREILIRAISRDIKPLINHIICSSSYLWYPVPLNQLYVIEFTYDRFINAEVPTVKLIRDLKLPHIREIIEIFTNWLMKTFPFLFKPSTYTYALLATFIFLPKLRTLIIPSLFNILILIFITLTSDFRFVLSSYLLSIILISILINHLRDKYTYFKNNNKRKS